MPTADDLLSDEDDPIVDDLLPETIEGVASRLLVSDSFEKLVYRECELDALWTLADIAIEMAALRETGHRIKAWQAVPEGSETNLVKLRSLLERAHDLTTIAQPIQAAEVLREAARLTASWS
jgi:hypothetical protein